MTYSHSTTGAPRTDDHVTYITKLVDECSGGTQTIALHKKQSRVIVGFRKLTDIRMIRGQV